MNRLKLNATSIERRYLCIVCPNCNNPKPQPVFKVKLSGITFWVCRHCVKHFPRE